MISNDISHADGADHEHNSLLGKIEGYGHQLGIDVDLDSAKRNLEDLNEQAMVAGRSLKKGARRLDHNVHSNPYAYMTGAFLGGALLVSMIRKFH